MCHIWFLVPKYLPPVISGFTVAVQTFEGFCCSSGDKALNYVCKVGGEASKYTITTKSPKALIIIAIFAFSQMHLSNIVTNDLLKMTHLCQPLVQLCSQKPGWHYSAVEGLPVQSVVNPRQWRAQSFSALSRSVTANLNEMPGQGADPLPATLPRLRSPPDVPRDAQGEPFNGLLLALVHIEVIYEFFFFLQLRFTTVAGHGVQALLICVSVWSLSVIWLFKGSV